MEKWNQATSEPTHPERFALFRPVRYTRGASSSTIETRHGGEGTGVTVNLSQGGLCLLMDWAPAFQEVLRILIPMPVPVARTPSLAEVRWVRALPLEGKPFYLVGLHFLI